MRACVCAVVCAHVGARSPNRGPAPLMQRPVTGVLKPALDSVRVCDSDRQRLRSLVLPQCASSVGALIKLEVGYTTICNPSFNGDRPTLRNRSFNGDRSTHICNCLRV